MSNNESGNGSSIVNKLKSASAGRAAQDTESGSASVGNSGYMPGSGTATGKDSSSLWSQHLSEVTFGDARIPAISVKGSAGRKLVKHVYPYRDGQELVDLGRQALTINVSAIYSNEAKFREAFGDEVYPGHFHRLMEAINCGKARRLRHPVFGEISARCESYSDTTQATELNTIRLELTFVEDLPSSSVPEEENPSNEAQDQAAKADKHNNKG